MNIGHSNVEFKVPDLGMSLKRSHKNLDNAKEVKIKLKTGAKLGNLMAGIYEGGKNSVLSLFQLA